MQKKIIKLLSIACCISFSLFGKAGELGSPLAKIKQESSSKEEERLCRRIRAHMVLCDHAAAVEEARQSLRAYPDSLLLHECYIQALANSCEEKLQILAWEDYIRRFPEKKLNRPLIEEMAWGVLKKASQSSSIVMREMALIAAFLSQDSKGVAILLGALSDRNYAVRAVAVKLSSHFRDSKLVEEVKRLFREEKVWTVRQEILEAVGNMKITDLRGELESLIASDESLPEEKALAIASLLELFESLEKKEVDRLSFSDRAGLRQLACRSIAYFQSSRDLHQLMRLAKDSNCDVRMAALQAIGKLRPSAEANEVISLVRGCVGDACYEVALSAAWVLTFYLPEEGKKAFLPFLDDPRREVRILAAAALGSTGPHGIDLILEQFAKSQDPFVRLNLSLSLIGQRKNTDEAADYLKQLVLTDLGIWCRIEAGDFSAVSNILQKKRDALETKEIEDQLLRIELLNLLAIVKLKGIEQAIRQYLSEKSWEISAAASVLLLTEGDEAAIDIVKQLLVDKEPRVRLRAALILSLWSREESAIQILEEGYAPSDRSSKSRILEGIGRIGSCRSIPFLLNVLKDPSQTLRLIAAMALIQCLNH